MKCSDETGHPLKRRQAPWQDGARIQVPPTARSTYIFNLLTTIFEMQHPHANECMRACRPPWGALQADPMSLVMEKLVESGGLQQILILRQVCKSWKAATLEYTGALDFVAHKSTALFHLSEALPSISKLRIESDRLLFLRPLAACSRLSSLCYVYRGEKQDPCLDLTLLPSSLRDLNCAYLGVDSECFEHIEFVGLTKLNFSSMWIPPAETQKLLQFLPKLQVSTLFSAQHCHQLNLDIL